MKAKFNTKSMSPDSVGANRKERLFYKQYTAINSELRPVIELRLYESKTTAYACIWVRDRKSGIYVSGGGKAGGYGYHKASAAAENAIRSAGVSLSEHIEDRGDGAIKTAMTAIMKALGYRKHNIIEAHA